MLPHLEPASRKTKMLTLIAPRRKRDELLETLAHYGMTCVNASYGQGTVQASVLKDLLGLVPEEKKIVITGLIVENNVHALFEALVQDFDFDKPNTGIAFTVPVGKLLY